MRAALFDAFGSLLDVCSVQAECPHVAHKVRLAQALRDRPMPFDGTSMPADRGGAPPKRPAATRLRPAARRPVRSTA
jgi:hypothetical protein